MQYRKIRRTAGAAGRAVDTARLQRRAGAHRAIRFLAAKHHVRDFIDAWELGILDRHLLGQQSYLIGFYERLLDQGRRMLHMHFEFLERTPGSEMLTGEHDEMLAAITARDADRADELAHAHTRQFRDNFIRFMSENYGSGMSLSGPRAAQ